MLDKKKEFSAMPKIVGPLLVLAFLILVLPAVFADVCECGMPNNPCAECFRVETTCNDYRQFNGCTDPQCPLVCPPAYMQGSCVLIGPGCGVCVYPPFPSFPGPINTCGPGTEPIPGSCVIDRCDICDGTLTWTHLCRPILLCTPGDTFGSCGSPNIGNCRPGQYVCQPDGQTWICEGGTSPQTEICGNGDEDCDGSTDEGCSCTSGQSRPCGTDVGICQSGTQTCINNQWGSCEDAIYPQNETCGDGDEDCDGITDEGCICTDGQTQTCGPAGIGICHPGTQTCSNNSWGACQGAGYPQPETCNGQDDDCDGQTDEGCDCTTGTTQNCGIDTGVCQHGTQTCVNGAWGACQGNIEPMPEICGNGLDDDCDGTSDEDCICIDGSTQTCGPPDIGICQPGIQTCINDLWGSCQGAVYPQPETCGNGLDDDCDGIVDDGCACIEGSTQSCGPPDIGICQPGIQTCTDGQWGSCENAIYPQNETCGNGLDDDCDGLIDEGCFCTDGQTRTCGPQEIGVCQPGIQTCSNGAWGACTGAIWPMAENCSNGLDDDCDGSIDCSDSDCQGLPVCSETHSACSTGFCYQAPGSGENECTVDADCPDCTNGQTRTCGPQEIGICQPGIETCANDIWGACTGAIWPIAENCDNGQDDDCDGFIDCSDPNCSDFCSVTHGACSDQGICYQAPGSGDNACTVSADCVSCVPTGSENTPPNCSDGLDNDCDGDIDCSDLDCQALPVCLPGTTHAACSDQGICYQAPGIGDNECTFDTDCAYCGNGIVDPGEECDGEGIACGAGGTGTCRADCTCNQGAVPGGVRLLISSARIIPSSPPLGSPLEKVEVLVRNVGTVVCSGAGKITLEVTDSDNKKIVGIDEVKSGFTVLVGEEIQVDFVGEDAPDTSGLEQGAYGLLVTAYCPPQTFQDQKTFYFSMTTGEFASIPETSVTAVLSLLTIVVIMLFYSKK